MNKNQKICILLCVLGMVIVITSGMSNAYNDFWTGVSNKGGSLHRTINWVGIISLGISISSFVGVFILGDKKK